MLGLCAAYQAVDGRGRRVLVRAGGDQHQQVEGPDGDGLYCPDFADVVIRDPETWQEAADGV
ncbi:hypothetical protein AB0J43_58015, partial [Nonomuraea fuscirosea]